MTAETPYFNRHVVFDHLPKTAGQAINAWLRSLLGERTVSDNLVGNHNNLLREYGACRIISGHMFFHEGEELDSRYAYMTVLRDPIDRVISWLYYLINDVPDVPSTSAEKRGAQHFVATDGEEAGGGQFLDSIQNLYCRHFSSIHVPGGDTSLDGVDKARRVLSQFRYVGLYEDLPAFTAMLSNDLLEIENVPPLAVVNKTTVRPKKTEISSQLRARIADLNRDDLVLYEYARQLVERRARARQTWKWQARIPYRWRKDERPLFHSQNAANVVVHACRIESEEGVALRTGCWARLSLDFSIAEAVPDLLVGVHIHDLSGRWIFGTNSALQGLSLQLPEAGRYSFEFVVQLNISAGTYVLGFSLYDQAQQPSRLLAWWDELARFGLDPHPEHGFAGIVYLPTRPGSGLLCMDVGTEVGIPGEGAEG